MVHSIIGTAGHVDHGKTTLIRALTGVNTDRLQEEQKRGMTIELGFAPLTLPSGRRAGVVDVPGHEKFLKNMLAGATGVDVVLLVVAADEGVMPQTEEHLDILSLLGVEYGVVAVTKTDMVDEEWLELVIDDVRARLSSTTLANAAIVPVCAMSGNGLDALRSALDDALERSLARPEKWSYTRLPIDRVFSVAGHGTVVTGTLTGGRVRTGDRLELLPRGKDVRVRQIQVHDSTVDEAAHGQRVALNLSGVDRDEIDRGMVLAAPGMLQPAYLYDAELLLLAGAAPIEHRQRMRLHVGTAEILCRVRVIGSAQAEPGERTFVQFELEQEAAVARGDRFILRTYSPAVTAGGGRILAPASDRRRRFKEATIREFQVLSGDDAHAIARLFTSHINEERSGPAQAVEVARDMCMDYAEVAGIMDDEVRTGQIISFGEPGPGRGYMTADYWDRMVSRMRDALSAYHAREPLRRGMPVEELRTRANPDCDAKAFAALLARAVSEGVIRVDGTAAALPGHRVSLDEQQGRWARMLEATFSEGDALMSPPEKVAAIAHVAEAGSATGQPATSPASSRGVAAVFDYLVDMGTLVRVGPELIFHKDALARAVSVAKELGADGRAFTAAQYRDALGSSRKFAVALLEQLDSNRVTVRKGDERALGPAATL